MRPYPVRFQPHFKHRVWGGRALEQYRYQLPHGRIGEGWMIADHTNGTSTAANGKLKGRGLGDIRERFGKKWLGAKGAASSNGRFPLLVKLLDCSDNLSVQVHPGDDYEGLAEGELGKTEMWYVLSAKPGSRIIYGLQDGITRESFTAAVAEDRILEITKSVDAKAGDSFYIPAGTVHALGSGVLVVEIQQNSDTTYRLFDYNRPDLNGNPRELHLEDSLKVISFGECGAVYIPAAETSPNQWFTLAYSPYFVVEKGISSGVWGNCTNPDSFTILIGCEGSGTLEWKEGSLPVKPADCYLLPAPLGNYSLHGSMTLLRVFLP
ncbi:type I phosphomannose isomerase catalytic subunit [Paenibacillus sp. FJAT-26967]|uniref:type I phosphomannose isomerase catalytic subunit n=1 Tax=Paenibacillus sp. FJAT-26967 TaxID=1729690 RepID=UPI0008391750|nr:type I phosphomannose isomerase catalytic subunit [Paenibacillus sp. FJAT-26967]